MEPGERSALVASIAPLLSGAVSSAHARSMRSDSGQTRAQGYSLQLLRSYEARMKPNFEPEARRRSCMRQKSETADWKELQQEGHQTKLKAFLTEVQALFTICELARGCRQPPTH